MNKKEKCQAMYRQLLGLKGAITNMYDSLRYLKYTDSNVKENIEYAHKMKKNFSWYYNNLIMDLRRLISDVKEKTDYNNMDFS